MIQNLSNLEFVLLAIAFISGVMIGLQAAVNRAVWGGYLVLFFGSIVTFAVLQR